MAISVIIMDLGGFRRMIEAMGYMVCSAVLRLAP